MSNSIIGRYPRGIRKIRITARSSDMKKKCEKKEGRDAKVFATD